MLSIRAPRIGYGSDLLLADVNLKLPQGAVWGLIAPNGHGKTTLMRAMAGQLAIGGTVEADGMTPRDGTSFSTLVMYSPGDDSLLDPAMTPRFHLGAAKRLYGSDLDVIGVADEVLATGFLDRPVRRLSQGMRQQVTLGVARMAGARYLLLDEPMNALDPTKARRAGELVRRMAAEGSGILVSSHILRNLEGLCDAVVVFRDHRPIVSHDRSGYEELFLDCYEMDQ